MYYSFFQFLKKEENIINESYRKFYFQKNSLIYFLKIQYYLRYLKNIKFNFRRNKIYSIDN